MRELKTQTSEEFAKKLTKKRESIIMCDKDGNCNGCNGCCGVLTQITTAEFKILRRKFKKKHLMKFLNNQKEINYNGINGMCFFFIDGKCDIYNLRPEVCKKYHCDPRFNRHHKHTEAVYIYELLPSEFHHFFSNVLKRAVELVGGE